MIASDDVRRVTFDRAMRGYRCEDVDDYLKQVADSIDSLAAENDDLQKKLVILAQRIDQYRADEDTLSTTMINAQRLGENVIKEAKQKAAEIIRAANIKAEDREQRARDEVELAQQELVTIKQEADAFKKRLMDLYRQHIEMIAKIPEYHTNRAEQQAAQPQPEPQEAPQQPAPQPVEQPAPAPQPEPEPNQPIPENVPASQPAAPEESYPAYEEPEYYEAEPEEPAQPEEPEPAPAPAPGQPLDEEKIDTVEFAFAPKTKPILPDDDMPSVAGLYGRKSPPRNPAPAAAALRPAARAKMPAKPRALPKRSLTHLMTLIMMFEVPHLCVRVPQAF